MRSLCVVLSTFLVLAVGAGQTARAELLTPVAMATSGASRVWFAYADGSLYSAPDSLSAIVDVPAADRGVAIRALAPRYLNAYVFILYADDQVWSASRPGIDPLEFVADVTRPDNPNARAIWVSDYGWEISITVTYDDGEVWAWSVGEGSTGRRQLWERTISTTGTGAASTIVQTKVAPNPSTHSCRIDFTAPKRGPATVRVLDVRGRTVRRLVDGLLGEGPHSVTWDGRDDSGEDLPAGVYFSRIQAGGTTEAGRIVLVR